MSVPRLIRPSDPCPWQYHPRSDHHSKVACWGVLFDLLLASDLIREHAAQGSIAFGINHDLVDHTNGRRKNLDLVLCRPAVPSDDGAGKKRQAVTFAGLAAKYRLELTPDERAKLDALPALLHRPVASTLIALEAKAAMTEFGKARPRLYDELASSHVVVHGDTDSAIAVGLAMINGASRFISPTKNPCIAWGAPRQESPHDQPTQARLTVDKIRSLPRRSALGTPGFDAIAAIVLDCRNDPATPVTLVADPSFGAPPIGDVMHYETMINRVAGLYASRFPRGGA